MPFVRLLIILFFISLIAPTNKLFFGKEKDKVEKERIFTNEALQEVSLYCDSIYSSVKLSNFEKAQVYYKSIRVSYKKIQWLAEYISSNEVKLFVNGPPLPKHDQENGNKVYKPHGMQFLEEQLFDTLTLSKNDLLYEINILRESLQQINTKNKHVQLSEIQYWDAMQFELIRLISLHLNGYDSPVLQQNVSETAIALDGIKKFIKNSTRFEANAESEFLLTLDQTKNYLNENKNYETFNRLTCLKNYFQPLYEKFVQYRKKIGVEYMPIDYAINLKADVLFGNDFYNLNYFNRRSMDNHLISEQIALGKILFYDPILSGNNQRSCASCHQPKNGFSDNKPSALTFSKKGKLERNTPGLINVAYQKRFFYDGRAFQLEEQASEVMHAQNEMNTVPHEVVNKLHLSDEYIQLFKMAFKGTRDTVITFYGVLKAIAEYERSLTDWDAPFDKYLREKNYPIKNEIKNGYNIFMGKALCGSCHFLPLLHGLVPPFYTEQEFEVIGVPEKPNSLVIDKDSGRYRITKKDIHLFSFKTTGLRNLAYTKPYMHHGKYKSLEEVIDFYINGGSSGFKEPLPNQTLPFDSLQLTKIEKKQLIQFLKSLNSPSISEKFQAPKKLPQLSDAKLNKRTIGGDY